MPASEGPWPPDLRLSSPLLDASRASAGGSVKEQTPRRRELVFEIARNAAPNMAMCFLTLLNELTNTVVLGRLGSAPALAAVGLGNMMQNCAALSIGYGICGALDTLVSQAWGAGRNELTAHYLQRCRVLVSLQLLWILPLLLHTEPLLLLLGQDPAVARYASDYNRASSAGIFAVFQAEATRRFLQNRGNPVPGACVSLLTSTLHVGWAVFFVNGLGLGNAGAGWANCVTWWTQFALLSAYLAGASRSMGLPRRSLLLVQAPGLAGLGHFVGLAVPATMQLAAEWWFWEVVSLVVGLFGPVALAAHSSAVIWGHLSFMPTIGLSFTTASFVGRALGEGRPQKAAATVRACVSLNLVCWTVVAGNTILNRRMIAQIFSPDERVQGMFRVFATIFAVVGFLDSTQNIMGAALRGMGRQLVPAVTYAVAFYGIMLPIACAAGLQLDLGVYAVWCSFGIGTGIAVAVFGYVLSRTDWASLADEARDRISAADPLGGASPPTDGGLCC